MIGRLSGVVVEKRGDVVILDVQGVGYLVHLSLQSMSKLPAEGGRAQLRCYTHVRDDALQLFGFVSPEEEELFHLLIWARSSASTSSPECRRRSWPRPFSMASWPG